MMSSHNHIVNLLVRKMESKDHDFRYMATSDLLNDLKRGAYILDDESQKCVVKSLIDLLKDSSMDVQNVSMKCLVLIIKSVKENLANEALHAFCDNVLSNNDLHKNTSSIGLKTLIQELTPENKALISLFGKICVAKLLPKIDEENFDIQLEIFETFSDMLAKFGYAYEIYFDMMLIALYPQLKNSRSALAKRAVNCVAYIAKYSQQAQFDQICIVLMDFLRNSQTPLLCRNYVAALQAVCNQSPQRFVPYIPPVLELIHLSMKAHFEEDFIEMCFIMYETFLKVCNYFPAVYFETMVTKALELISYDPHYSYLDEENDEDNMDFDEICCSDSSDDDYDDDDDDMSFKVRRGATHLLATVIRTKPDMLAGFFKVIAPVLIGQFKEREEYVRVEIYKAYVELLIQTKKASPEERESIYFPILRNQLRTIVPICERQLKEKSSKSRKSCFTLLKCFVELLPNALVDCEGANYLNNIIPGILYSMKSNNSNTNTRIEALQFLNLLFKTHSPSNFVTNLDVFVTEIQVLIQDPFYRVTIEALLVLRELITIIRPSLDVPCDEKMHSRLSIIYNVILTKLRLLDADQDVKEEAITCMSRIICSYPDGLNDLTEVFTIFLQRLQNETTRLTCLKALNRILEIPNINLSPLFPEAFQIFPQLLRQSMKRFLQSNTLTLIELIGRNYKQYLNNQINHILIEPLILVFNENDLHNSILALGALTSLVNSHTAFIEIIPQQILPIVICYVGSHQCSLLNALETFLVSLLRTSFPGLGYTELKDRLTEMVQSFSTSAGKDTINAVAKCVASLALLDNQVAYGEVENLLGLIEKSVPNKPELMSFYALSTLGFIGRRLDMTRFQEPIKKMMNSFANNPEIDINFKEMTSHCLGRLAAGNLDLFLNFIMENVNALGLDDSSERRTEFIMLNALKMCLLCGLEDAANVPRYYSYLDNIWALLLERGKCKDDGIRHVIADCMSKVILMEPDNKLGQLMQVFATPNTELRSTVFLSFGCVISDFPRDKHEVFSTAVQIFLASFPDSDLNIRRLALNAFNSLAHNRPEILRKIQLNEFFPLIYNETDIRTEMIRSIEMGPFKHVVDDGYALRKSAYDCMFTMLENLADMLNIDQFILFVEKGLADAYEIKLRVYLMLRKLCESYPDNVRQRMSNICTVIQETLSEKVKPMAVRQEVEKLQDLQNAALRAVYALFKLVVKADPKSGANSLLLFIHKSNELRAMYNTIEASADSYF